MGKVRKSRVKAARQEEKRQLDVTFNEPRKSEGEKSDLWHGGRELSVSTAEKADLQGFPPSSPLFESPLHHLVSQNHQLPRNPPPRLSCISRKCPRNHSPSLSYPTALLLWLMGGQMVSAEACPRLWTLANSVLSFPPPHLDHPQGPPLCIQARPLPPHQLFQGVFCLPSPHTSTSCSGSRVCRFGPPPSPKRGQSWRQELVSPSMTPSHHVGLLDFRMIPTKMC